MMRGVATILAAVIGLGAATASAQSYSPYYGIDPYDVPTPAWATHRYSAPTMLQMDPFGVGYNLLSGYRPVYGGARQPVGHEVISTQPNGNGYVYRPIYGPSPGYRYSVGGSLIVEYPSVRYPAPAYLPADVPQVAPSTFELQPSPAEPSPPNAPSRIAPSSSIGGPREF